MRRGESKPHVFVKFADHAFYSFLKKSRQKEEKIMFISGRLCRLWRKEDEEEESAWEGEEKEASKWDKLID